jgi:hypothetical protein
VAPPIDNLDPRDRTALERIGENLKAARTAQDGTVRVSQDKLAAAAGLSRTVPGLIENAQKESKVLTLIRLARAADIPPMKLFEGVE